MSKIHSLFNLYETGKLPTENGFIITSSLDPDGSLYTTLELISYANVKEIISDGQAITFRSDGLKLYILIEPGNYHRRQTEPVFRDGGKSVPYRFHEMEIFSDYRNNRIMVGKQPIVSLSSFSVDNPEGDNYSIFIYRDKEVSDNMKDVLTQIMNKDLGLPRSDARIAAVFATDIIVEAVKV